MPMTSVTLRPGVNTQQTLSANESGVSQAQLIRYKDGMVQSYGGWQQYISANIPSTVRALHPWQDIAGVKHLGVGATQSLSVITAGSNLDVTPQKATVDSSTFQFNMTAGSTQVTVIIGNSSGYPSIYNTAFFNTPISAGGLVFSGAYPIVSVLSTISFTISASAPATITTSSSLSNTGSLPTFTVPANSPIITVNSSKNGVQRVSGLFYPFYAPTSLTSNLIVQGPYQISTITDTTSYTINAAAQSTAAVGPITMNSSKAEVVYYVTQGPGATGTGWSAGAWSSGTYGGVVSGATPVVGTPITATDWTLDNWGEILLACPENGPIYAYSPDSGYNTAQVIGTAPFFNGGIFVAMPIQILVAWRSCQFTGVQDNLLVVWSDSQDYTNWVVSELTAAGSFRIPTGSKIIGGLQAATQGIIWTDVDVWNMVYQNGGGDLTFSFNRLGSGCGLIGKHAAGVLGGNVYWCGINSFFIIGASGVVPLNCTVWDFIFQNLNTTYQSKIVCATNSAFNEVAWFFPSAMSTGENDAYVKYNILEQEWDYGYLARTAWTDVSILGTPLAADTNGTIYQHEVGNALTGAASPYFRTGWYSVSDGNDLGFVDFIIPDFIWGTYSGAKDASLQVTVYVADYPGDTPRSYGPFTITQATEYISLRARGRLVSFLVTSNTQEFFRLGRIRFRFALAGRR